MKYTIEIHGRGGECYIHLIDDEQKETLIDSGVEQDQMDSDKIAELLNKPDVFSESDDILLGPYTEPLCLWVRVLNENGDLIWESPDEYDYNYDYEYKWVDDKSLIAEDYVKGHFYSYHFEIDEEFNPENLSFIITEMGEKVEIITGLYYNEVNLENFKDYDGDYWSKGINYHVN
jgi:hypothetical protein